MKMMKGILGLAIALLYLTTETNSADSCFSDSDCGEGLCCVTAVIGGSCHRMSQAGERCSLQPMGGGHSHAFGCPCASGATCKAVLEDSSLIPGFKVNHTKCV